MLHKTDLPKTLGYIPKKWLSISSLKEYARCPFKFMLSSGSRLRPPGTRSAFDFGTALHKALPMVLINEPQKAFEAFMDCWDEDLNDAKRNPRRALETLNEFSRVHNPATSLYDIMEPPQGILNVDDKISDYEIPFAIDIGLPGGIPLVGRIDALVKLRDTGEIFPLDWKTTSQLTANIVEGFETDPQVLGYSLAAEVITGKSIPGSIVEFIRVSTSKNEILPKPYRVPRFQVQSFIEWARYIGTQILASEERGYFQQDWSACYPYPQFGSHGFQCDYMDFCRTKEPETMLPMFNRSEERPFDLALEKLTEKKEIPNVQ